MIIKYEEEYKWWDGEKFNSDMTKATKYESELDLPLELYYNNSKLYMFPLNQSENKFHYGYINSDRDVKAKVV